MTLFIVAGRKNRTVIHCRKTMEDAYQLRALMIADGFKNVRVSERQL